MATATWFGGPGSGHISQGGDVSGTRCPSDASNRGRVDRDTSCPRNAPPKRRSVQRAHCPRDKTSETFCFGTHRHGIVGILPVLVRATVAGLFPGAHFNDMAKTSLTDCVWRAEYQLQLFLFNLVSETYIQAHIRSIIIIWTFFPFNRILLFLLYYYCFIIPVFLIRISLNADPDPDPAIYLNATEDPDFAIILVEKYLHFFCPFSKFFFMLLPI